MKQALKRLYDVPMLGYALRLVVGLARLPAYLRAHDEALRNIHGWVQQADAKVAGLESGQLANAGRIGTLEAGEEKLRRLATEAHNQATFLTGAQTATAERLSRAEQSIARLHAGLDRHLPAVLGFMSSSRAALRGIQRERQAAQRGADAIVARLGELEAFAQEAARALPALESSSAAAEEFRRRVEGRLGEIASWRTLADERLSAADARAGSPSAPGHSVADLRATLDELRGHVSYLLNRVEFVRRETLFELRYGTAPATRQPFEVAPRIVNGPKVAAAAKTGLRINVGCGHIPMEGYVNVDLRELPGVDVIAEAGRMPFDPGSVAELHSAHLVEHFPREQLRREILPYWKSLLREGGLFRSVVPDAATMIDKYKIGEMPWEDLREVTFGGQDYAGDFHYDMFTPESLKALLEEAGFRDVAFPVIGRPNGRCYEMEVSATV